MNSSICGSGEVTDKAAVFRGNDEPGDLEDIQKHLNLRSVKLDARCMRTEEPLSCELPRAV